MNRRRGGAWGTGQPPPPTSATAIPVRPEQLVSSRWSPESRRDCRGAALPSPACYPECQTRSEWVSAYRHTRHFTTQSPSDPSVANGLRDSMPTRLAWLGNSAGCGVKELVFRMLSVDGPIGSTPLAILTVTISCGRGAAVLSRGKAVTSLGEAPAVPPPLARGLDVDPSPPPHAPRRGISRPRFVVPPQDVWSSPPCSGVSELRQGDLTYLVLS